MALKVALTGGGTGGHVFPVVAVADEIKSLDPKVKFLWIGSEKGLEKEIAQQAGISFASVPTGKLRRYFSFSNIIDIFKIPFGILKAFFILGVFRPDVLFSKGGYVSYPTVFAAWLRDIPILLHETDSVPGLANRRLLKKATLITTSFKEMPAELPEDKTIFTGQPIRAMVASGDASKAKKALALSDDRPVLAIFGGSQGAKSINKVVFNSLPELLPHFQIIHQVGPKNIDEARLYLEKFGSNGYRAEGFFTDNLWDVYALADIIVARSGGQVHELAALGKPVVLLPLATSASNHQVNNAESFAKKQAAISIQEANLTPKIFVGELTNLLHNNAMRLRLGNTIKQFETPLAAKKLAYWTFRLAEIR